MSRGKQLQEMDVKTQQSKTAVNAGAKPSRSNGYIGCWFL